MLNLFQYDGIASGETRRLFLFAYAVLESDKLILLSPTDLSADWRFYNEYEYKRSNEQRYGMFSRKRGNAKILIQ